MNGPTNVRLDDGAANRRILAREVVGDYRRIEQASLKQNATLKSPEAKRIFARYFHSLQINTHFISEIARIRLSTEDVEKVEDALRSGLVELKDELGKAIEGAQLVFRNEGITSEATYDTKPLEIEVGVISSFGRRYLECLQQLDQLMPMLRTLEILEVITPTETDRRRALFKRVASKPPKSARFLATGLRVRMNEVARQAAEKAAGSTERAVEATGEERVQAGPRLPEDATTAPGSSDRLPPSETTEDSATGPEKSRSKPDEPTEPTEAIATSMQRQ